MIEFLISNSTLLDFLISCLALIISLSALWVTIRQYVNSNRARIVFHIIQQNQKLHLFVMNLGMVSAFDVNIQFNYDIENPVRNLRVIPPGVTFQYTLMHSAQVSSYPEMQFLEIKAKYKDTYCLLSNREEISSFPILELLKYTAVWNEKQHCFEINKL